MLVYWIVFFIHSIIASLSLMTLLSSLSWDFKCIIVSFANNPTGTDFSLISQGDHKLFFESFVLLFEILSVVKKLLYCLSSCSCLVPFSFDSIADIFGVKLETKDSARLLSFRHLLPFLFVIWNSLIFGVFGVGGLESWLKMISSVKIILLFPFFNLFTFA